MATRIDFESRSPTLRMADLSGTQKQVREGVAEVMEFAIPTDVHELHIELQRRTEKTADIYSEPVFVEVHYKAARVRYANGEMETDGYLEGRDWWRHAYSWEWPGGVLRLPADGDIPERDQPLDTAHVGIPHARGTDVRVSITSKAQTIRLPILYIVS